MAEMLKAPVLLVHVSSALATKVIRKAQTRVLPVYGETCPHYLFLMAERMRTKPAFEGAKYVCSPPLREDSSELEAIWRGVQNGTFTTISSDHAPTKYDHPNGKMKGLCNHGPQGRFKYIPNGLPGLETRLPLLFTGGILSGRISPQKFVELTSSNPAKLYGLKRKGAIAPGYDADLTVWYPQDTFEPFPLTNDMLHHAIDYTPFEGFQFQNWPRYTLLRGKMMFAEGKVVGKMGTGDFVHRSSSLLATRQPVGGVQWLN
jgi:dihydropyrimidinase